MVLAVEHIRRMRGGAQSHLMRCDDGGYYIVKFQNNPEGNRTLANDLLGTLLARHLGLPVSDPAIVEVTEDLKPGKGDQMLGYDPGAKLGQPGKCFGSKYLTPRMPGRHCSSLEPRDSNRAYLSKLRNLEDFAGMLVFDKWVCNTDPRQVVFVRSEDDRDRVVMIDFGYCFHGPYWRFPLYSSVGVFDERYVYNAIEAMEAFEPWLQMLENDVNADVLTTLAGLIPPIWYDFNVVALSVLLTSLDERRKLVRESLRQCCSTNQHSFRNWIDSANRHSLAAAH